MSIQHHPKWIDALVTSVGIGWVEALHTMGPLLKQALSGVTTALAIGAVQWALALVRAEWREFRKRKRNSQS